MPILFSLATDYIAGGTQPKLQVEEIQSSDAVLFVRTASSAKWPAYVIQLTSQQNGKEKSKEFREPADWRANVTKIDLLSLLPYTRYKVRVRPVITRKLLGKWTNYCNFRTLGSEYGYCSVN